MSDCRVFFIQHCLWHTPINPTLREEEVGGGGGKWEGEGGRWEGEVGGAKLFANHSTFNLFLITFVTTSGKWFAEEKVQVK